MQKLRDTVIKEKNSIFLNKLAKKLVRNLFCIFNCFEFSKKSYVNLYLTFVQKKISCRPPPPPL
jgi:hypothetical protein